MVSTASIKNLQKTKKYYFQTPTILVLELKEASRPFSKKHLLAKFWFKISLSRKMVSTSSLKNCKKLKISLSKCSKHSFLMPRLLQNHFSKSFLWSSLNLNDLEGSVSLSQKTVSTLSIKNLQKPGKCSFQTLRTFVFELKVASKSFSKKLLMTKF